MSCSTFYHTLFVVLAIGAVANPANASSSGGGLRRVRFHLVDVSPPHISQHERTTTDEPKVIDEAFGHMEEISETESFFRRLIGGSVSMMNKSSNNDEATISNDDTASILKPSTTTTTTTTLSPSTNHPTKNGMALQSPSASPESSPPMPTMTPTIASTPICNLSEEARYEELLQELGIVSMSDLANSSTPQGKAFNWIVSIDELHLCPGDDRLIQRYSAVVLYFSTRGEDWNDNTLWLSASSECEWAGLTCNFIGEVISVKLDNNNLEGTLPMELGALLVAESIELHNSNIRGLVPTSICDNILPLGELGILTADCGSGDNGKPAMMECNCCTVCY